jgi:hypothetical protein
MKTRRKLGTKRNEDESRTGRRRIGEDRDQAGDGHGDHTHLPATTSYRKQPVPPARRYKIHIRDCSDVKRVLSSNINMVRRGELTPAQANSIAYNCNQLMRCLELMDFGAQLKLLEKRVFGDDMDLVDLLNEENKQVEAEDADYDEVD